MSARVALSFSRDLEFATETELAKRMGCSRHYWLRATAKELIDNGLDACEEAGIETRLIQVEVDVERHLLMIADNGPGMAPELVERLCVRSERTSTREAFSTPDRGAQGNALQVLMALPFGFGLEEAGLMITSRGVEHTIRLRVNRLEQRVDLERTTREVPTEPGTTVAIRWPEEIDLVTVERLISEHAWLNPHAEFRLDTESETTTWDATAAVQKWTPGLPVPAHWYDLDRFAHRVRLEIKRDPEITVAQFLTTFKGLTSSTKRSEVAAVADLSYKPLAALLDGFGTDLDRGRTALLLSVMQEASRPPKHAVLGAIGKETFGAWAASNPDYGAPELLAYTTVDGVVVGSSCIPYRWEIGFCHLPGATERQLLVGHNYSPAISVADIINVILPYSPWGFGSSEPIALFLHRITPDRQTLDYGKSRLALSYEETSKVRAALSRIAKPWLRRRDAESRGKKPPRQLDEPKPDRITIKDAVQQLLPECYNFATSGGTYPTTPRQIYYVVRPKVLKLAGQTELGYGYFAADLLPRFLQGNADITRGWRIHYKARGTLREPHTGYRVPLGTAEVAAYRRGWTNGVDLGATSYDMPMWAPYTCGPHNRYGALIIVEKDGIAELLIEAGVGERFDVAIVGNEGQSVEAELRLADHLGLPVFVLHDFDRTGLTICQNLRTGTWRHKYENEFDVIEIGLRLDQVDGLESEPITEENLKSVGDDRLRECGATDEEIKFLRQRRIELNALITEQLVALVEGELAVHGIGKVIPEAVDLAAAWRAAKAHAEIAEAVAEANKRAERWRAEPAPDDLVDRVRDLLEHHPEMSWDAALRRITGVAP
jgi:hypothetical protein